MGVRLVVDNSVLLDADVDPQEMEDLRDGFDEWLESQGELSVVSEKVERLRRWVERHEEKMIGKINE